MSGLFPPLQGARGAEPSLPLPSDILEKRGVTPQIDLPGLAGAIIFNRSIAAKLWECGRSELSGPLEACRTEETICRCLACNHTHAFWNRCDRFYCPICAPRLAFKRRERLQWWTNQVKDPKHLVLTARNAKILSREYVKWFKVQWASLRRSKFARNWIGGLYAFETTNEGRGWHFHMHAIIEADWIDNSTLAIEWARRVNQDFAIVHVKAVGDQSYAHEIMKYCAKGSEVAAWPGHEIAAWIDALTGSRMFGVFGQLFKDRALREKLLQDLDTPPKPECPDCHSTNLVYGSPNEDAWRETTS